MFCLATGFSGASPPMMFLGPFLPSKSYFATHVFPFSVLSLPAVSPILAFPTCLLSAQLSVLLYSNLTTLVCFLHPGRALFTKIHANPTRCQKLC